MQSVIGTGLTELLGSSLKFLSQQLPSLSLLAGVDTMSAGTSAGEPPLPGTLCEGPRSGQQEGKAPPSLPSVCSFGPTAVCSEVVQLSDTPREPVSPGEQEGAGGTTPSPPAPGFRNGSGGAHCSSSLCPNPEPIWGGGGWQERGTVTG